MYNRTDLNHTEIVACLKQIGCTVVDLSQVGKGCPDILVGYRGKNYLLEIKRNKKQGLRKNQQEFFDKWFGQCCVITDEFEAFKEIGITKEHIARYSGI